MRVGFFAYADKDCGCFLLSQVEYSMTRRSRAREVAFQLLYQEDLNPRFGRPEAEQWLRGRLRGEDLIAFAEKLVFGVRERRAEIDALLRRYAANWPLHRMAATDRNILRLGAFELLAGETPPRVVIDEAVELAKRFGGSRSAQFVNGILDKIMHETAPGEHTAADVQKPSENMETA